MLHREGSSSCQHRATLDGVLVQWGDRLFYPANRVVLARTPKLTGVGIQERAHAIRQRIHAVVVRRAPQVMVKVTGGGRGMAAIAAHLRYISKGGRLPIEADRGEEGEGKEAQRDLVEQGRLGGSRIPETSERREAFNIMLPMPAGTKAEMVQSAAREFAKAELANHRCMMVLPTHQANPHVHLSAEGRDGQRLNPRKEDLRRWRETPLPSGRRANMRAGLAAGCTFTRNFRRGLGVAKRRIKAKSCRMPLASCCPHSGPKSCWIRAAVWYQRTESAQDIRRLRTSKLPLQQVKTDGSFVDDRETSAHHRALILAGPQVVDGLTVATGESRAIGASSYRAGLHACASLPYALPSGATPNPSTIQGTKLISSK